MSPLASVNSFKTRKIVNVILFDALLLKYFNIQIKKKKTLNWYRKILITGKKEAINKLNFMNPCQMWQIQNYCYTIFNIICKFDVEFKKQIYFDIF